MILMPSALVARNKAVLHGLCLPVLSRTDCRRNKGCSPISFWGFVSLDCRRKRDPTASQTKVVTHSQLVAVTRPKIPDKTIF